MGGEADLEQQGPAAITTGFKPILGGEILEESIRSLEIDRELIPVIKKELRERGRVVLDDVPLPDGGSINLELHERNVFPAGARLVMEFGDGPKRAASRPLALPEGVLVMTGHIQGDENSFAALALWDGGTMGLFQGAHGTSLITSGKFGDPQEALVYDLKHARGGALAASRWECGTPEIAVEVGPEHFEDARTGGIEGGLAGQSVCEVIELGIEYDFDMYSDIFSSDEEAAILYTAFLVMSLDEILRRDLGIHVTCTYVRLRESAGDPWDGDDTDEQLAQLIAHYDDRDYDPANSDYAPNIYALMTSRDLNGGIAEGIGILCNGTAHMVCGSMSGAFPYPLENYNPNNLDFNVTAHEIGHILGGSHSWLYCPPLDTCKELDLDDIDCSDEIEEDYEQECMQGTMMSYCHQCDGGEANIHLGFHEVVQADIREYLDGIDCVATATEVIPGVADEAQTSRGTAVTIDVLANDRSDCGSPVIRGFQVWSAEGGYVERLEALGPFGRDVLRYTPPSGFPDGVLGFDSFAYYSEGAFGTANWTNVTIKVWGRTLEYLVVDSGRDSVERFDAATNQYIDPVIPDLNNLLADPSAACAAKDGRLLIADVGIDKILAFDMETGEFLDTFHSSQYIEHPIDMVSTETHVYVGSRDKQSVVVLTQDGELETILQSGGHVQDLLLDEQNQQLVVLRGSGNFDGAYEVWDLPNEQMVLVQPVADLQSVSCIALHPDGDFLIGDPVNGGIARYNAQNQGFAGWFLHWQVARFFGIGEPTRIEVGIDGLVYVASSTGVHRLTLEGWYVDEAVLANNESFEWPSAFHFLDAVVVPGDLDGNGKVDGVDLALLLGDWNGSGVGDINGDGTVDGIDLAILLGGWSPV